ncbi:DUF952 domain-containing protein [Bdellovibrio sp. HCB2-146]|uniref:DUF952 domain-containing protein n=1 Tax=Bdellovibrio sp. HCB2-146 TaxID=3394362 RepID=UPI0039BD0D2C
MRLRCRGRLSLQRTLQVRLRAYREISEERLKARVKYEDLYNLHELYPHIYGPVNLDSVLRVIPFPPREDGTFALPSEL